MFLFCSFSQLRKHRIFRTKGYYTNEHWWSHLTMQAESKEWWFLCRPSTVGPGAVVLLDSLRVCFLVFVATCMQLTRQQPKMTEMTDPATAGYQNIPDRSQLHVIICKVLAFFLWVFFPRCDESYQEPHSSLARLLQRSPRTSLCAVRIHLWILLWEWHHLSSNTNLYAAVDGSLERETHETIHMEPGREAFGVW